MPIWKEERGTLNPLACSQVGFCSDFPGSDSTGPPLWAEELKAKFGESGCTLSYMNRRHITKCNTIFHES